MPVRMSRESERCFLRVLMAREEARACHQERSLGGGGRERQPL